MASQGDDHVVEGDTRAGGPSLSPSSSTGEQVEAARAAFSARREAENVLADASRIRASAAADADALLVDAQIMADRLQSESLAEYERLVREATERSDGILARARAEADRLRTEAHAQAEAMRVRAESEIDQIRAQVREELREEQLATLGHARHSSDGLLRDLESGVLGLGTTFERANASVADVVATIGRLRTVTESALPVVTFGDTVRAGAGQTTLQQTAPEVTEPVAEPVAEAPVVADAPEPVAVDVPEPVVEPEPVEDAFVEETAAEETAAEETAVEQAGDRDRWDDPPAGGGSPMIGRVSTADTAPPEPASDENATSFLGTDPPRPVTDWSTGADATDDVVLGTDRVVTTAGSGDSRPLGWLFRATS
ncbi:ATP synthase F0 subunit B [Nocardioides sp. SOB77]|uniref:ATP synthase F0 subunit B n=1 Tax=Nocardioides oceani TaxID=3058369 RepID=A0ABT8FI82_9ACTN|nr:ATP synthase F0 subunit B [Nocardioides oceani]MDN4174393.1 ATP synthase F0 subunit B [Nocardioides oceani]